MTSRHDVAMGLRTAYWAMHRQTEACLAKHGVTANQFVLLALLAEGDGVTQQELVRRASSDPNTIRAMLLLLENRGFVARSEHPTDGRALCITLTRKGCRTYEKLLKDTEPLRQRILTIFQSEEMDIFVQFLARISEEMTPSPTSKSTRLKKGDK